MLELELGLSLVLGSSLGPEAASMKGGDGCGDQPERRKVSLWSVFLCDCVLI